MITKPWHILIIDDSAQDRADMRQMLLRGSDRQYLFEEAQLGRTGLAAMKRRQDDPYDCVLLDYYLPDMNAHEVMTSMDQALGINALPIVIVTGTDYR